MAVNLEKLGFLIDQELYCSLWVRVFRVRNISDQGSYVIKLLDRLAPSAEKQAFTSEFERHRKLCELSPYVLRAYELIENEGCLAMLLEDMAGVSLSQKIQQKQTSTDLAPTIEQLLKALDSIHTAGYLHGAYHSGNIIVSDQSLKLTDFGKSSLRRPFYQCRRIRPSQLQSLAFQSPEQTGWLANYQVDHRSDYYALGITIYQLITGELPHHADSWRQGLSFKLKDGLPYPSHLESEALQQYWAMIASLCSLFPDERPSHIDELFELYEQCRGDRDLKYLPIRAQPKASSPSKIATQLMYKWEEFLNAQTNSLYIASREEMARSKDSLHLSKRVLDSGGIWLDISLDKGLRKEPFHCFEKLHLLISSYIEEKPPQIKQELLSKISAKLDCTKEAIRLVLEEGGSKYYFHEQLVLNGIRTVEFWSAYLQSLGELEGPVLICLSNAEYLDSNQLSLISSICTRLPKKLILFCVQWDCKEASPQEDTFFQRIGQYPNIDSILDLRDHQSLEGLDNLLIDEIPIEEKSLLMLLAASGRYFSTDDFKLLSGGLKNPESYLSRAFDAGYIVYSDEIDYVSLSGNSHNPTMQKLCGFSSTKIHNYFLDCLIYEKSELENLITRLEPIAAGCRSLIFLAAEASMLSHSYLGESVRAVNQKFLTNAATSAYKSRDLSSAHRYFKSIVWDHPVWIPDQNVFIMARYLGIYFGCIEENTLSPIKHSFLSVYDWYLKFFNRCERGDYLEAFKFGLSCLESLSIDTNIKWKWHKNSESRKLTNMLDLLEDVDSLFRVEQPLGISETKIVGDLLLRLHEVAIRIDNNNIAELIWLAFKKSKLYTAKTIRCYFEFHHEKIIDRFEQVDEFYTLLGRVESVFKLSFYLKFIKNNLSTFIVNKDYQRKFEDIVYQARYGEDWFAYTELLYLKFLWLSDKPLDVRISEIEFHVSGILIDAHDCVKSNLKILAQTFSRISGDVFKSTIHVSSLYESRALVFDSLNLLLKGECAEAYYLSSEFKENIRGFSDKLLWSLINSLILVDACVTGYQDRRVVNNSIKKILRSLQRLRNESLIVNSVFCWIEAELHYVNGKPHCEASYEVAIKHFQEIGNHLLLAVASERFGSILYRNGKIKYATTVFHDALESYKILGANLKYRSLRQELSLHQLIDDRSVLSSNKFKYLPKKVDSWSSGEISKRYSRSIHSVIEAATSVDMENFLDHAIRSSLENLAINSGANKVLYFYKYPSGNHLEVASCDVVSDLIQFRSGSMNDYANHFSKRVLEQVRASEKIVSYSKNDKAAWIIGDPYLIGNQVRSILAIPHLYEEHWSAIYVERSSHDDPFSQDLTEMIRGLLVWIQFSRRLNETSLKPKTLENLIRIG